MSSFRLGGHTSGKEKRLYGTAAADSELAAKLDDLAKNLNRQAAEFVGIYRTKNATDVVTPEKILHFLGKLVLRPIDFSRLTVEYLSVKSE